MKKRTIFSVSKFAGMLCLILALVLVSLWAPCSWGGEYPERAITVVVPYSPGATDREARIFAPAMAKILGQPVVVVNRPGAGSSVGCNYVVQSKPDGYTLLFAPATSFTLAPLVRKLPFSVDDIMPVACMTHTAQMLAVSADAPWKTTQELIDDAKKRPGQIIYGTSGVGAAVHICGEAMTDAAGIKFKMVPFKGMSKAMNAMLGGHIDVIFVMPQAIIHLVKGGKIRALANCFSERLSNLPDVPAITEAGIPFKDEASVNYFGFYAPKGTPQPIIDKLTETAHKVITDPEIISAVKKIGGTPDFHRPKEFKAILEKMSVVQREIGEKIGLVK